MWVAGALLVFAGLLIIAYHQYWSSPASFVISLFGWFLALRGLLLLTTPQLIARGGAGSMNALAVVRTGFSLLVMVGLWITHVGWFVKPPASGV